MKSPLFLFMVFLLVAGCGYQWQDPEHLPTLSIPLVSQDEDGLLTAELMEAMSKSGSAKVVSEGGEYTLKVCVLGEKTEKIGFRVDPQKIDHKIREHLLATEARRCLDVDVFLYQGEKLVFGPYRIQSSAEYDYVDGDSIQDLAFVDRSGNLIPVLPFSLGQLEPSESASLAASSSLYKDLARKVVHGVCRKLK